MNKSAIQRFAIWARTELIAQVSQRAYQYGITKDGYGEQNAVTVGGRALTTDEQRQRKELVEQIRSKGYAQVMEEVAYTWFNRFIALRFMEVNNYLPSHIRVFSDSTGAFKPEILNDVLHLDLPGLNTEKVAEYIEKNQTEDLYRYLLLTQCNALNASLPQMFERMGGFTELLLPNNILKQDSILGHMVTDIPEEDWTDQVQIIGWLYQYYISEKHNEVIDPIYGKTIKKEDIPAATQLFTTDWVVRYMVDNSLGRYWIERHPESKLREKLAFFVLPKSGKMQYINETIKPQELTFFDPCMGSGHILVYAFDVLMEIYKECGYGERDAATEIIQNNLFGLDIDERCSQLAYFAVMMKARSYDRRFLSRGLKPHVLSIRESNGLGRFTHPRFMPNNQQNKIGEYLVDAFRHAKEIGSLQAIEHHDYEIFVQYMDKCDEDATLDLELAFWQNVEKPLMDQLVEQAKILSCKYTVVCTNPPYMNKLESHLKDYVIDNYKAYSGDLFSAFMIRNFDFCVKNGYSAFMTPNVWMFIKTYEQLRNYIIQNKSISSLIQMATGAFFKEATVDICAFVMKNVKEYENGIYIRLEDFKGDMEIQKERTLEAVSESTCKYKFERTLNAFCRISGQPIAYWLSDRVLNLFGKQQLDSVLDARIGLVPGDNSHYLRYWHEVIASNIGFAKTRSSALASGKKWFPYNKGGSFRKWFGNRDYVVNWLNDGHEMQTKMYPGGTRIWAHNFNLDYIFKEHIGCSAITSGDLSFRWFEDGFIFDSASTAAFTKRGNSFAVLGYLNSAVCKSLCEAINPTINFKPGNYYALPYLNQMEKEISSIVERNISISQDDWNVFEQSWDFTRHPLVPLTRERQEQETYQFRSSRMEKFGCIAWHYEKWVLECETRFVQLKANEEELNRIFIDIYGLQDELAPEVEDKDVTVRKADLERDIRSLISYAVGCMFGRYSLDEPGLAYAGGEWDASKYSTIIPDKDNIIPICDDDYFDDDITGRFVKWVETVYGTETLEENLKFIADALGGKGTPREVIRSYFINDFYADHLKIYQKRPIYWLFDSGKKNGFKALVYMHRYQSDLLARMRTDYVHEQQERYRTQLSHLADAIDHASASERVKLTKQQKKIQEQALEIQKYEEKVHHLADQNISIDLDDGVKHNYELFADVLAKIK